MNRMLGKSVRRSIRESLGRYLAILSIIALGCGFFSGLRICRDAMVKTGDDYLRELCFYDFRLISELGLTDADVQAFASLDGVNAAEGMYSADAMFQTEFAGDTGSVYHVMSLPERVNLPALTAGRLPETPNECLADANRFLPEDIGTRVTISANNSAETSGAFSENSFTIVGLADSPMYLNYERGTTAIGAGTVTGFLYVPADAFTSDCFTEICLTLKEPGTLFSDTYNASVGAITPVVTALLRERAIDRLSYLYRDAEASVRAQLDAAKAELNAGRAQLDAVDPDALNVQIGVLERVNALAPTPFLENAIATFRAQAEEYRKGLAAWEEASRAYADAEAEAEQKLAALRDRLDGIEIPATFVLTRNENIGYVCFDSDSSIVQGISMVFPVFFFLLAALICSTTMTRMVSDERTQNGVLKALGFSKHAIMSRYTVYAGSAAVIGSVMGYFIGTLFIPKLIWAVYDMMYGFAPIRFVFDPVLFLISFSVALLCSVGSAWLSCRASLAETPASLIRPRAPKNAKRILLERVTFLWRRMRFLHKVSARNIFRYRKRFFMMILGIAGCTALLVTGFGIRDSISGIVDNQFGKISVYDLSVTFTGDLGENGIRAFREGLPDDVNGVLPLTQSTWDATGPTGTKSVSAVISDGENMEAFWHFRTNGEPVAYPGNGETILDKKLAGLLGVTVGDRLTLSTADRNEVTVTVTGIFDNYVYNYVFLTPETCQNAWGTAPSVNSALLSVTDGADLHATSAAVMAEESVATVTVNEDLRVRVNNVMSRLNYIVLLVLVCAGALALIVLYNLTNINITERSREIATLKVLGFFRRETAAYVFRENAVLTVLGAILGLPLGTALHAFVMSQISVDLVAFDRCISVYSYLISLLITFLFAAFVAFLLRFRIARIHMADSLKSVE